MGAHAAAGLDDDVVADAAQLAHELDVLLDGLHGSPVGGVPRRRHERAVEVEAKADAALLDEQRRGALLDVVEEVLKLVLPRHAREGRDVDSHEARARLHQHLGLAQLLHRLAAVHGHLARLHVLVDR